jgi:transcriptional regulator with XRE-family HTH domain
MDRTPTQLLTEIRAATNLSDQAIGARIGCSQPTVHRIRNGNQQECKSSTLMAILRLHAEVTQAAAA